MSEENGLDQGEGTQESSSEEVTELVVGSPENQNLSSQADGSDTISEQKEEFQFQHPLLRGKTPEEVERLFRTQNDALLEQNTELNRLHSVQASAPPPGTRAEPGVIEEPADYGDDFIASKFRTVESRLTKKMEDLVAPLASSIKTQSTVSVRDRLKKRLKNFSVLEPHIDRLIRGQGNNPEEATEDQLETLYHTALGYVHEQGLNIDIKESPAPSNPSPDRGNPPVNIPQHRPSSAPIPKPPKPARRELTENEKRLAKEFFPRSQDPEGDYLKMQEAGEDEIVEPGFSRENW